MTKAVSKISFKKIWIYIQLVIGCAVCGIGINWVAIPNGFAVTGMTGLAMTIAKLVGINYTWIYYGFMVAVLILTLIWMGIHEVASIIFLSLVYPAVLVVLSYIPVELIFKEKLIAVAVLGICLGVGTGICYRLGYSYGGTDTVGKLVKSKFLKSVPLKTILLGEDILILLFMLVVFDMDIVAYAFVSQIVYANSLTYVVFNMGPKLFEIQIICNASDDIKKYVIESIHKSVTEHHVVGGYSGEEKVQLDCVCTSAEYVKLREHMKELNTQCFMKVIPLANVIGENKDFKNLGDDFMD